MYCQECAAAIEPNAEVCGGCGATVVRAKSTSSEIVNETKAASRDAIHALKVFAVNPVGGLLFAFESLNKRRARNVGLVFSVIFSLCVVIGTYMTLPAWAKPDIKGVFGLLILGVLPPAGVTGVGNLARKFFGAAGSVESDLFIAGASLLPVGFVWLLTGVLGIGNIEVIAVLGAFAGCYTILMLYTGCKQISKITEAKAAATVPVMLLLSAWLCKIIFVAML